MSKYKPEPAEREPVEILNASLNLVDREFRRQVEQWVKLYENLWCCPISHGDDARSMEDMQTVIDSDPVMFQILLSDSVKQVNHFMDVDASAFISLVEPRHLTESPYEWVEGELTLSALRPEWDVQSEE